MIGCTGNSSRSAVCACCNLVLISVPEIISLQPVEVPDHGHYDQDPDHQLIISSEITLYISSYLCPISCTGGLAHVRVYQRHTPLL